MFFFDRTTSIETAMVNRIACFQFTAKCPASDGDAAKKAGEAQRSDISIGFAVPTLPHPGVQKYSKMEGFFDTTFAPGCRYHY
jgi:hypothetical protein